MGAGAATIDTGVCLGVEEIGFIETVTGVELAPGLILGSESGAGTKFCATETVDEALAVIGTGSATLT